MTNFTLTGTDNDGFRHRYSIKKNRNFKKAFLKFMNKLEFDSRDVEEIFLTRDEEENTIVLDVSEFKDCIRHFQNSKYDVDVFFGDKKVIIIVRTNERVSMVEYLENETGWVKPITIKKLNEKKKAGSLVPLQKTRN